MHVAVAGRLPRYEHEMLNPDRGSERRERKESNFDGISRTPQRN